MIRTAVQDLKRRRSREELPLPPAGTLGYSHGQHSERNQYAADFSAKCRRRRGCCASVVTSISARSHRSSTRAPRRRRRSFTARRGASGEHVNGHVDAALHTNQVVSKIRRLRRAMMQRTARSMAGIGASRLRGARIFRSRTSTSNDASAI